MYIGDDDPEDHSLCVVEHKAIKGLYQGLGPAMLLQITWKLEFFEKVPQDVVILLITLWFICSQELLWESALLAHTTRRHSLGLVLESLLVKSKVSAIVI